MDARSFIVCIKTEGIFADIPKDVETRFDTSNYELDELSEKIMKEFAALRVKTYSYLTDINDIEKKGKGIKICHKTRT